MKAYEILEENNYYECDECHCCIGEDWEYVDFSNKELIECPQCGNRYVIPFVTG